MQARYYDPVIGRFYSNDPIGFRDVHSFNRYTYANNNPYKYTDPNGESSVLISPKFTPRVSPVARAVRQGISNNQSKQNPVQQQTSKIANQIRDTVKNSKPEVRQPSLKEAPKAAADTTGGIISNLVKQIIKHADDFAGGQAGTTVTGSNNSGADTMSPDTVKVLSSLQTLSDPASTNPDKISQDLKKENET